MANHCARCAAAVHGVDIRPVVAAVDLGVDISAGTRRSVGRSNTKLKTAGKFNCRVTKLWAKRQRVRIFNTAALPKAAYGMQVVGTSPTVERHLRIVAGGHFGVKPGWCVTAAFALEGAKDLAVTLRNAMAEKYSAF